jgi:hypothetical protein
MNKLLFILAFIGIFSSTSAQRIKKIITVKPKEITSIGVLPIESIIDIMKSKKENNPISQQSKDKLAEIVSKSAKAGVDSFMRFINLPIKHVIVDSSVKKQYIQELSSCITFLQANQKESKSQLKQMIKNYKVPELILKTIKSSGERYGMIIMNLGFTRTSQSLSEFKIEQQKQINRTAMGISGGAIGGAIGYLTNKPGDSDGLPESGLGTYIAIIDSETEKIINCFLYDINVIEPKTPNLKQVIYKYVLLPSFSDYWVWYYSEADKFMVFERK